MSILILIIIWPILLLPYIFLWFSIGPPVLFKQRRPGYLGKQFTIDKFCTMSNAYDIIGRLLPDEKRITRVGMFVRSLSLVEFKLMGATILLWEEKFKLDVQEGISHGNYIVAPEFMGSQSEADRHVEKDKEREKE